MKIALATTHDLPVMDDDEALLLPHLPGAEVVAWEEDVDWAQYDAVILRSTWNYIDRLDDFLAWARRVSQVTRLCNPVETIEWNTDKRYLADLAERGLPVVPTTFVNAGEDVDAALLSGHVVVKPSVGNGSNGAGLFRDDAAAARAHLDSLIAAGKTAMIQPYQHAVDTHGETALMYVGGRYSHAARKAAILSRDMSWSTGIYADEKVALTEPTDAERALADAIVATLPGLAYARVDLLPGDDGPVILELELTEPSLFLGVDPAAPERVGRAFVDFLAGAAEPAQG